MLLLSQQLSGGYASPSARRASAVKRGVQRSDALPTSARDRKPDRQLSDSAPATRAPGNARRSSPNRDLTLARASAVSAPVFRWLVESRPARVRPEMADARETDQTGLPRDYKCRPWGEAWLPVLWPARARYNRACRRL